MAEIPADKTDVVDVINSKNDRSHFYIVAAYNAVGESKSEMLTLICNGSGGGGFDP